MQNKPKREPRKSKVADKTLTSSKQVKTAELKPHQKPVANFLRSQDISVVIADAGCSKDFVQMYRAIEGLKNKEFDRIIICKPIIEASRSIGFMPGAQPFSSKILTPDGWTTMGEIKKGDTVYAVDGKEVEVLGVYDHGERDVFEITTIQNRKTLVCDRHLWEVQESNYKRKYNKPKVVDTTYIKDNLINAYGGLRFSLPKNDAVSFKEVELPLHPYVLGCLLGDGSCKDSISICNIDNELLDRFNELIKPLGCNLTKPKNPNSIAYNIKSSSENNKPGRSLKLTNILTGEITTYSRIGEALKALNIKRATLNSRCANNRTIDDIKYEFIEDSEFSTNPVKNILNNLGLNGLRSYEKFIPDVYKYSSYEQRLELLKGLLDTDGNIKTNGEVNFTTTSKKLADDITELTHSLGGKVHMCVRDRMKDQKDRKINGRQIITRRVSYQIGLSFSEYPELFYVSRKKNRLKKTSQIHKDFIKSVEFKGKELVRCIKINHPRELYITDDYIVTHNTLAEKTDMYLQSFYASIDKIVGKENANAIKTKVQFEHVGFQRGNTFPEFSCVIVSELQNLTASEAHTYITRLPQSSKMFLNADAVQSDLGMKSGLNDFLESISGVDNCAIAILDGEKHQMRRKEIIEITKKYIEIQKRKGKIFELDRSRFEYIEL